MSNLCELLLEEFNRTKELITNIGVSLELEEYARLSVQLEEYKTRAANIRRLEENVRDGGHQEEMEPEELRFIESVRREMIDSQAHVLRRVREHKDRIELQLNQSKKYRVAFNGMESGRDAHVPGARLDVSA